MKQPLKDGLITGIVVMVVAGSVVAAFAETENDFFQFCTTKAYGWPAPWKIDYCECEGSKTTYPTTSKMVNLCMIAGSGIAGFALLGGISMLRTRQNKHKHTSRSQWWQRRITPLVRFALDAFSPPCHTSNVGRKNLRKEAPTGQIH